MSTSDTLITTDGEVTELAIESGAIIAPRMSAAELAERKARLQRIASLDEGTAQKISSQYWEASKGDSIRGEFLGFRILTKKDEDAEDGIKKIPAVVIDTLDGIRLCGAMQVVENFQSVPQRSGVNVTCVKSKSGSMKEFEVLVFEDTEDIPADVQ